MMYSTLPSMDRQFISKFSSDRYFPSHILTYGSHYFSLEHPEVFSSSREKLKGKRSFLTHKDIVHGTRSNYGRPVTGIIRSRGESLTNALSVPAEFRSLEYFGLNDSRKDYSKPGPNVSHAREIPAPVTLSQPTHRSNYIYRSNVLKDDVWRQYDHARTNKSCNVQSCKDKYSQFKHSTRHKSSDTALSREDNEHNGLNSFYSQCAEPRSVKPFKDPLWGKCDEFQKKSVPNAHSLDCNYDSSSNTLARVTFMDCPNETSWKELESGDILNETYLLLEEIGNGSFGRVFRALNQKSGVQCAIKCMKRCPKFDQIIRQELHVLELCKKEEAVDEQNIAKFYESFSWKGNICFVFELLCVNLYQIISRNNFQGLPCMTVKKMCACILTCLTFLHKHQIIHCDLKPENILIVHPGYPLVKVIDFGSSCHVGQSLYTYIQSRFYRAPEVILGMEYDTAIDIWSFGCITMELLTGTPLFPGTDEYDQMACIVEVLNLPPPSFLRNARRLRTFFCDSGHLRYHSADAEKIYPARTISLQKMQRGQPGSLTLELLLQYSLGDLDADLLDFIRRCLCWVPSSRITAREALRHPWLSSLKPIKIKRPEVFDAPKKGESNRPTSETDAKRSTSQSSRSETDH